MSYDPHDESSIKNHADKLRGHSLRDFSFEMPQEEKEGNKGRFGHVLERHYFGLATNSESRADFEEAGIELKAFPLKKTSKGVVSKERLVLNIINFLELVEEKWETSSFLKKNARLLLIGYLYQSNESYLDHVIKLVKMLDIKGLPPEDLKIICDDWQKIADKIRAGKAHELSESDTLYLGACTKGSTAEKSYRPQPFGPPAKQRAFSFKQRFLNALIANDLEDADKIVKEVSEYGPQAMTFEELVVARFKPFYGLKFEDIASRVQHRGELRAKSRFADITKAILGVKGKKIAEFEKAEVISRTIRLSERGMPEEDISFPAFKYMDLIEEKWEESDLRDRLTKRFFFVVYQYDGDALRLREVKFWGMPEDVLENEVKPVWERTIELIKNGKATELPKKSENRVCHVRPHAANAKDTYTAPPGIEVIKKSFWLNASYIKEQL